MLYAHPTGHINAPDGPFVDDGPVIFNKALYEILKSDDKAPLGQMVFSPQAAAEFVNALKLD